MAARCGRLPEECVFFYNASPFDRGVSPMVSLFNKALLVPSVTKVNTKPANNILMTTDYEPGQLVYVKPPRARCTDTWNTGKVTAVLPTQVEVNGIPRHVADIRHCPSDEGQPELQEVSNTSTRPQRNRRIPNYLNEYEL